jgi:hypothetical protein
LNYFDTFGSYDWNYLKDKDGIAKKTSIEEIIKFDYNETLGVIISPMLHANTHFIRDLIWFNADQGIMGPQINLAMSKGVINGNFSKEFTRDRSKAIKSKVVDHNTAVWFNYRSGHAGMLIEGMKKLREHQKLHNSLLFKCGYWYKQHEIPDPEFDKADNIGQAILIAQLLQFFNKHEEEVN